MAIIILARFYVTKQSTSLHDSALTNKMKNPLMNILIQLWYGGEIHSYIMTYENQKRCNQFFQNGGHNN